MLVRVNGELVHELYQVNARPGSRARLAAIDGTQLRMRYGWQLTSEEGGIYAGEAAMVAAGFPLWIASGDLQRIDEAAVPVEQLELAAE